MIDQKQIHVLLKKTKNNFIEVTDIVSILKVDDEQALKTLDFLTIQGYIEKSGIEGYWQQSVSGEVLSARVLKKVYKVETLQKHLNDFIDRVKSIDQSKKYPYCVDCMKITSEYPIENRSHGIEIAFSLIRKNMSEKEYEKAANILRKEYSGTLATIIENVYYPQKAVESLLKSGSHALKLTRFERDDLEKLMGHKIP